jgi:anaerobic ribonucleoside-triphosphate reductase activating protein
MDIRIAGAEPESIVDGPGIRFALFVQGCPHHCEGCHNPQTWDFSGGETVSTDDVFAMIKDDPLLDGVTFSGGEPFCQCRALTELADRIRMEYPRFGIMSYTGFTFEELLKRNTPENGYIELLKRLDGLVDGPFILEKKSLELGFMGSSNQRYLDVPRSLKEGKAVLMKNDWDNIDIKLV